MTIEEAIEILTYAEPCRCVPEDNEALNMAIDALEKQIPKKIGTDEYYPHPLDKFCPACLEDFTGIDTFRNNYERWRYCPYCGQAIDWSEQE